MKTWIIGAGTIALEHGKALKHLHKEFMLIGRSEENAKKVSAELQVNYVTGGIEQFLTTKPALPEHVVVAVPVLDLSSVTTHLLNYGVKKILVEKPGGLDGAEISALSKLAKDKGAEVYLAYNRRFYTSTMRTQELIAADGGASSFHFEFTEWAHVIEPLPTSPIVKKSWFLTNSTHVIDLAFFLGGLPKEMSSYQSGTLSWHPQASKYSGAGITHNHSTFSYCANWDAPGRWGVEVMTKNFRFILRPLEKIQVQKKGSVAIEFLETDYSVDEKFKPGFLKQMDAFMNGTHKENLLELQDFNFLVSEFYGKMSH